MSDPNQIFLQLAYGRHIWAYYQKRTSKLQRLHDAVAKLHDLCPRTFHLTYNGTLVSLESTPESIGMVEGYFVEVVRCSPEWRQVRHRGEMV